MPLTGFLRSVRPVRLLGTLAALSLGMGACGGGSSYGSSSTPLPPAAGNLSSAQAASSPSSVPVSSMVKIAEASKVGRVLADSNGMTLYTFKPDTAGKSTCNGSCATTWPPLMTTAATMVKPEGLAGDLGLTPRDDGTTQVNYNGQPLYLFSGDRAAGDANGQGIGGVRFAASVSPGATDAVPAQASPSDTPAAGNVTPVVRPAQASTAPPTATPTLPAPPPTPTPVYTYPYPY